MKQKILANSSEVRERVEARSGDCRIEMLRGGPALVRGAAAVRDDDGAEHVATRPVVAVCTCGLTQRGPWCDATHKVARTGPTRDR